MEANQKRNIQSGERYSHLFPVATNTTATIRKDANVYHTVAFIPKVVQETLSHTKQLAATLKADSVYDTCRNIWQFVYKHIAYKKDNPYMYNKSGIVIYRNFVINFINEEFEKSILNYELKSEFIRVSLILLLGLLLI